MTKKNTASNIYLLLSFASAFLFSMIFTVDMVYQITVAGLNPLQLVLIGTILELTVFLFEIPTGVVADLRSRRLSVIIGYALMGSGFLVEGLIPHFWPIAFAQILWGLGFTFTSGATQAWIADEIGEEQVGPVFLQGSQARKVGGVLGIPVSMLLGSAAVALPVWLGGAAMILLAGLLFLLMPETGFTPTPAVDRTTWASMRGTLEDAVAVIRRQRIMLILLGIGLFYGLYSEGFDRLWTDHLLKNFTLSWQVEPVIFFGIIRAILLVLGLLATGVVQKRVNTQNAGTLAQILMTGAAGIILALLGFGLTGSFWVALVLYWVIGILRDITGPLLEIWYNQQIDNPKVRATMFSVISQVDAVGQIAGGPVVGIIGKLVSVRAALVTSSLILTPVLALYNMVLHRSKPEQKDSAPHCGID